MVTVTAIHAIGGPLLAIFFGLLMVVMGGQIQRDSRGFDDIDWYGGNLRVAGFIAMVFGGGLLISFVIMAVVQQAGR